MGLHESIFYFWYILLHYKTTCVPGKDNNNIRWYSWITKMALNRNTEEKEEEERNILSAIHSLKFNFLVFHYAHPMKMLLIKYSLLCSMT
jgi:hypothetical protein